MVLHEIKLPHTFHGKVVCRLLLIKTLRLLQILECEEIGASRLPVLLIDVHILPARLTLSLRPTAYGKHGKAK